MIRFTALVLVAFLFASLGTAQDMPKKPKATPDAVKGKLPTGWSTTLKLTTDQRTQMYAVSSKYQQQIANLKDQEYRDLYKLLTDTQKQTLRSKLIGD